MLNGKQRAALRRQAHGIPALYQIGKDGITENVIKQFDDALEARELIKVHVLENSLLDTRDGGQDCGTARCGHGSDDRKQVHSLSKVKG